MSWLLFFLAVLAGLLAICGMHGLELNVGSTRLHFLCSRSPYRMRMVKALLIVAVLLLKAGAANCESGATEPTSQKPVDAITEIVLKEPGATPRTPLEFLKKLRDAGFEIKFHIVANGGAENTNRGSFSSFGTAAGHAGDEAIRDQDLTFGIFIEPDKQGYLCVQNGFDTKLLVEVITRDLRNSTKNFWELIGDGKTADWHFRTDSQGIAKDVARVNMSVHPGISKESPLFGKIARCSGCHTNGNLVMKELALPHNDWYSPSEVGSLNEMVGHFHLKDGNNLDDPGTAATVMFHQASEPEHLAQCVRASLIEGIKLAGNISANESAETDKSRLRAVFAPLEMNFLSDNKSFRQRLANSESVEIPAQFFVDARITGEQPPIPVPVSTYRSALGTLGSTFAADETPGMIETQHAFLVPVRSFADERVIDALIREKKIDQTLLTAILSVDWTTPIYSQERLQLMQYLPQKFTDAKDLRLKIISNIQSAAIKERSSAAEQLLSNLKDPDGQSKVREQALALLANCRAHASSKEHVTSWLKLAAQRRAEIQNAQTSKNPRGTILEGGLGPGGFRRIFPQYKGFSPKPHELLMDSSTAFVVTSPG